MKFLAKNSKIVLAIFLFAFLNFETTKANQFSNPHPDYEPDLITSISPDYLFEGDIVSRGNTFPTFYGNGVINDRFRWPRGVIPVIIDKNFSESERQTIYTGFKLIYSVSCISFKPREAERDYLYIQRGKSGSGCYSNGVGKQGGRQVVNLAENGCIHPGVAAHEFLHVVGLHHEQTRPDRDEYVEVIYENIIENLKHNFNKYRDTRTYGSYDFDSIMHYPSFAFSKNGRKTIVSRKNPARKLGTYEKLSKTDAEGVNKMYGDCKI